MAKKDKTGILLESGTNEIEIMEFTIDGNLFGINVAKVTEIMMSESVKSVPHAHPVVEGIFKPRDAVITVIDLPKYLMNKDVEKAKKDLFIVTNFNRMNIAFRVHTVVGISRISWRDIQKPDKSVSGGEEGVATGIAQYNGELVTILDFEKIVAEIAPETAIQIDQIETLGTRSRTDVPIVMAEDSVLLSKMIRESLSKAGYINVKSFNNGQEAWDFLREVKNNETVDENVKVVITDIEMPKMDGHRLTKLIKSDSVLKNIPVIIFSSLINEEMRIKGKQLGADEQLSKPEIVHLVEILDHFVEENNKAQ